MSLATPPPLPSPLFLQLFDSFNLSYYPPNPSYLNPPQPPSPLNLCTFLSDTLLVSPQLTGLFSSDLTNADDILIAVLSLVLLLAIEGVVSAVLLRTTTAGLDKFGFTVGQCIDLARDFRLVRSLSMAREARPARRKWNYKLLLVAFLIVTATFGLQVFVLFLTNVSGTPVPNSRATFRLVEPLQVDWDTVWRSRRVSNHPCTAVSIERGTGGDGDLGLEQRATRISACLTSDADGPVAEFEEAHEMLVKSRLHEFGSEHEVQIGTLVANYSARGYFRLAEQGTQRSREDRGGERIMRKVGGAEEGVWWVHLGMVGALYAVFQREGRRGAISLGLEDLNALNVDRWRGEAASVDVTRSNGGKLVVRSVAKEYVTRVTGRIPGGAGALLFLQGYLKGMVGVQVAAGDTRDLMMASGNIYSRPGILWVEEGRVLNWLGLVLGLVLMMLLLCLLRWWFRPSVLSELAGAYVGAEVGLGEHGWDPVGLGKEVEHRFGVTIRDRDWEYEGDFIEEGHNMSKGSVQGFFENFMPGGKKRNGVERE